MFQYDSYVLEINPVSHIKGVNVGILRGTCKELDFEFTNSSNDTIISEFKNHVNNLPKSMKVVTAEDISRIFTELEEKYGKDKAIGIFVGKTQECVRLIDRKSAAQILFEKLQEHQNKEEREMTQDKDVEMVNNFIANIKAVIEEMKSVEETPFLPMIRDLKLKGVYDLYKNILPVALDQYKGIYDFLLTQEPKKEEESRPLGEKTLDKYLDKIINTNGLSPGQVDDELTKIYNLLGSIVKCNYLELKKKYFERLESQK